MHEQMEGRIRALESRVASLERAFVALVADAPKRRRTMSAEEFQRLCGDEARPKGVLTRYLEEQIGKIGKEER